MDKVKRLLERGYFPSQLPPPFTTELFAAKHASLFHAWSGARFKNPSGRGEFVSVARAGHARRPITIPNPVNQLHISRVISDHWSSLRDHYKKSKLSLSVPILKGNRERATEIIPLSNLAEKRLNLSAGYRYILRTDVARFYQSIYTHSIPWAIHGKAPAKANTKNKTPAFFGNLIDRALQLCQERQTIGIPIGPDTSHIASEIITTSVDILLKEKNRTWPAGYRHVDDYFLCFNTREEAVAALSYLQRSLREFELDINATKTSIVETVDLREESWVEKLKSAEVSSGTAQRKELHQFFSLALELSREDENSIKYALRKSASIVISPENWEVYESYLLRCSVIAPNCISTIAQIISTYQSLGSYRINKERILNFCVNTIILGAKSDYHSEIIWALYLAKELSIKLPQSVYEAIARVQSSICALVALDLQNSGLIKKTLPIASWLSSISASGLQGPMWLLIYEACLKGWLPTAAVGFVSTDPHFGPMLAAGVSFYDENRRASPLIRRVRRHSLFVGDMDDFEFDHLDSEYVA